MSNEWERLALPILLAAEARKVEVEILFSRSDNLTVKVRKGQVDQIRNTSPAGLSLRVFSGKRCVSGATSHLEKKAVVGLVERLAEAVALVDEDEANGLPEKELLYSGKTDLDLYDPALEALGADRLREMATAAEQAALAVDKRITNSDGGTAARSRGSSLLMNSLGLRAEKRQSSISVSVSPVAEDEKGEKVAEGWFSYARHLADLAQVEEVGRIAGGRCAAMLGAGTGETGRFPVLFAPETACALVDLLFQCASGTAIYRNASFLAGKEGEAIASPLVSVVSDPMRPRGLGSTPFDAQGVATSRRLLLDQGLLAFYPCDTFSGRRLQRQSTGHAGSGGLSSHNLFVENGVRAPEEMLKQMGEGLLVTAFIGFGFNQATGDFSRGIRGFWVEGGRPVRPVQEMTVAGNLGEMLKDVVAVGNDLEHRFGTDSPSLLVREMSVAGG